MNMLKSITLENFKCFGQKVSIPLAPITLIYGENSAGKSTILQAMMMLRNALAKPKKDQQHILISNRYDGSISDIKDLIHDGKTDKTLSISFQRNKRELALRFLGDGKNGAVILSSNGHELVSFNWIDAIWTWRINWTLKEDLVRHTYEELIKRKDDILVGYKRLIEHAVLSDYLVEDPTAGPSDDEVGPPPAECSRARDIADKYDSVFIAALSRDGLPEYFQTGLPGYTDYLKTDKYLMSHKNAELAYSKAIAAYSGDLTFDNFCKLHFPMHLHESSYDSNQFFYNWYDSKYENSLDFAILAATMPEIRFSRVDIYPGHNDPHHCYLIYPEMIPIKPLWPDTMFPICSIQPRDKACGYLPHPPIGIWFASQVKQEMDLMIQDIYSLPALREPPKDSYIDSEVNPGMTLDPVVIDRINDWIETLNVGYKLFPGKNNSLRFVDKRRDTDHSAKITEVGFGFSQLLPIVEYCCRNHSSIITIEQPELHIHPGLQAELGGLFKDAYKKLGHQIIAETHSEHLMLRLQKLVRKKELTPDDICVLYVSRGHGKDGSRVQQLRLDNDGSFIDRWPNGFFPERFNEIME